MSDIVGTTTVEAIRDRHQAHDSAFRAITPPAESGLQPPKAVQAHADRAALLAEVDRMRGLAVALVAHGNTTWPDGGCGTGRAAGQMVTGEAHIEVIDHLTRFMLADPADYPGQAMDIKQAADEWEQLFPGTVRLDAGPAIPQRRGPDGRPLRAERRP